MAEEDAVEFFAKYKNWVAVKKISITENTKPEEIALQLSSIRQSIDRKSFEILGINVKALDEYAEFITKGKRKSWPALAEVLQNLGKQEAKEKITEATGNVAELQELGATYLFRTVAQKMQFDFDVNPELLQKAYPDLKIPKPLGRKPKG